MLWRIDLKYSFNLQQEISVHFKGPCSATHWHWQDDLWVACKVSNMSVQRDTFLCSSCLAHRQGHTQDGISTKFS